jgi:hypothetical protein
MVCLQNKIKRFKTKHNGSKQNKTGQNKTQRVKTKHNGSKQNTTGQNIHAVLINTHLARWNSTGGGGRSKVKGKGHAAPQGDNWWRPSLRTGHELVLSKFVILIFKLSQKESIVM